MDDLRRPTRLPPDNGRQRPARSSANGLPVRRPPGMPEPTVIQWQAVGLTDVGLRRSSNQDHLLLDEKEGLFIVADGMGGHKAGERASRMACWHIYRFIRDEIHKEPTASETPLSPADRWGRSLRLALESANRHIYEYALSYPQFKGMGTTLVALLLHEDAAYVAHAGDSRLYRLTASGLLRVTKDHSRLQDLLDICQISEDALKNHPFRNVITRSLGNHPDVEVDVDEFRAEPDETLLICTDGLCGVLTDAEILQIVEAAQRDLERSCRTLLQAVTRAGAPDNVSIIMVRRAAAPEAAAL